MGRSRSENPKEHISYVKQKLPNGWKYVLEVVSVYDPAIQNSRKLRSKIVGKLPPGEEDVNKRVPTQPRRKKAQPQPDAVPSAVTEALADVEDPRRQACVTYPLEVVLLVVIMAGVAGFTSNYEIAEYWKTNRKQLTQLIRDFPDSDISHDTVRRLLKVLGQQDAEQLIQRFASPVVEAAIERVIAVDGKSVRASKGEDAPNGKYFISAYESETEVCLSHKFIDAKHNEITYASELIEALNVQGAVITCDALNTQTQFADTVLAKGADYCFALKCNQKLLHDAVKEWFDSKVGAKMVKAQTSLDADHGRIERRSVQVLPASVLKSTYPELLEKWSGLEEGSIVRTTTSIEDKKHKVTSEQDRYFITSLCFDSQYIAQRLLRVIRSHWSIENKLHWVLDVVFSEDRTKCSNVDYLKGRAALTKISYNLMSRLQTQEEERTGKKAASKKSLQARYSNPETFLQELKLLLAESN